MDERKSISMPTLVPAVPVTLECLTVAQYKEHTLSLRQC